MDYNVSRHGRQLAWAVMIERPKIYAFSCRMAIRPGSLSIGCLTGQLLDERFGRFPDLWRDSAQVLRALAGNHFQSLL